MYAEEGSGRHPLSQHKQRHGGETRAQKEARDFESKTALLKQKMLEEKNARLISGSKH